MHSESAVVFITGAGKRVGAALARDLHRRGYAIALHYRSAKLEAESLAAALNAERADSCLLLQADLDDREQRDALIPRIIAQFGRLDVLINNASSFSPTPIGDVTDAHWDALFDSNARAPFFLSQAAAPFLRRQHGCIVNIADIFGQMPKARHTVYCMAKAALIMMTRSLALELAPDVRVNAIAPGAILWPESGKPDAEKSTIVQATPLARMGDVDDICQTAVWLIEQAKFSTGQVIAVDGGRSLR
ncbi:MAG: pteridine reductase [Arenimonas sp.]|nr:pteridine reductase [Arenimonas sp.]MBP7981401.1 pteridine reductase [Arenimonas sp.]